MSPNSLDHKLLQHDRTFRSTSTTDLLAALPIVVEGATTAAATESELKSSDPMKFRNYMEAGIDQTDFFKALQSFKNSAKPIGDRMALGKDIGEEQIRTALASHGVNIVPSKGYHADARLKIDGYLNGEPVQIKLRTSGRDNRNDIAFELVRNHDKNIPVRQELQDFHHQGRDYRGTTVKHYFVMNQQETAVYHISADSIKKAVEAAISDLDAKKQGFLQVPFTSTNGVQLRPTTDRDPKSFTPSKVMAFVPIASVQGKSYDITPKVTAAATQPVPTSSAMSLKPVSPANR